MKKINNILVLILLLILGFGVISCGKTKEPEDPKKQDDPKTPEVVKYTVKYENTSMSDSTIVAGEKLSQPSDPSKNNHIFLGWYNNSSYEKLIEFPITVNNNMSLYARFVSYEEAFKEARINTIGDKANSYEFDYTLDCNVTYGGLNLVGNTIGNSKYNKDSEVSFYDEHVNSGILFYDGTKYQIRKGTTLQKIALNENGKLNSYKVEQVDENYKYDSSAFAKALFKWDDEKLKSIEKTSNNNEYKLNTDFSFSDGVALVGNYINHPVVLNVLGELPSTQAETDMFVTFKNGYINTYKYVITVNVSTITFKLEYLLTFKNINKVGTITPKNMNGISVTSIEIESVTNQAFSYVSTLKALTKSSYDFELHTALGFSGKNNIDATFKGSAIRKKDGGTTYFHNDIDIATNYDNADLYKDKNINDIHVKKSMLSNKEVWLIEKKLIGGEDLQVTNYTENTNDTYYLLGLIENLNNYSFVQKIVDGAETEYVIGLTKDNINTILSYVNKMDIDPFNRGTYDVKIFGDYSNVVLEDAEFIIKLKNNTLYSIELDIEGTMDTYLTSSRDFTSKQNAEFKIEYEIKVTNDCDKYEPYETVKKAK